MQVGVVPLHPLGPSVLDPLPLEVVLALVEYLTLVVMLRCVKTAWLHLKYLNGCQRKHLFLHARYHSIHNDQYIFD